jgi:hypothetical protein
MKKIGFGTMHRTALKLLAAATIAVAVFAGAQAAAETSSVKDGVAVALTFTAIMAVGLAPGFHSARCGLTSSKQIDRLQYIKELRFRARALQPATARKVEAVLAKAEETLSDPEKEKAANQKMGELIKLAHDGDVAAKADLARIRVVTVDNFVLATTNPITFFDTVNLADDEIPYIENTSRQEISVDYLGQDGRARKTQGVKYQEQAQIALHQISTEEFEYQLIDIYKGTVKDAQLANIDMARDIEQKLNKLMWPFVRSAIGPFNLTGAKSGRVYVPHSIVNVKNLPTTNLLTPADNTPTTLFRKSCMDVVLKYAASWGDVLGQTLKPAAVYIPSSEVMGFLEQITLTSQPNSKVEEIFEYGFVLTYGGARWQFIPDATLDPDAGIAYVKFNKPIGQFFRKQGLDKVFEDETIDMQKQNKGSVSMSKVIGFGLPITWRLNIAAVQYHDAR